jgi:hypothetical protein
MTPTVPPGLDLDRLKVLYEWAEQRYLESLSLEHFMESTPHATQRKITLESFDLIRVSRPDIQCFNELLVQYPRPGQTLDKPGQVVPDNMVVVHHEPINAMGNFGRYAITELELEAALHDGWMRFWFRGELLPLPGDLLVELEATKKELTATKTALEKERNTRTAIENAFLASNRTTPHAPLLQIERRERLFQCADRTGSGKFDSQWSKVICSHCEACSGDRVSESPP